MMPYDEKLAERVRAVFQSEADYTERKMFSGVWSELTSKA